MYRGYLGSVTMEVAGNRFDHVFTHKSRDVQGMQWTTTDESSGINVWYFDTVKGRRGTGLEEPSHGRRMVGLVNNFGGTEKVQLGESGTLHHGITEGR